MLNIFSVNPKFELDFVINEINTLMENGEHQEAVNNFCLMAYSGKVLNFPFLRDLDPVAKMMAESMPEDIIEKNKRDLEDAGFYDSRPKYKDQWPSVEERARDLFILWSEDASFSRWRCADT